MASSLTVALAALGGVVLAGVVAHGAWQARRAGPRRAVEPAAPPAAPREPSMDAPSRATPTLHPAELSREALEARPPKRPSLRLDALIDAIAPLAVEAPIAGEMVLMHLPTTRRAGSKPFL